MRGVTGAAVFSFLLVECLTLDWWTLNEFRTAFHGFRGGAELSLATADRLLQNTTHEAALFLSDLHADPSLISVNTLPPSDPCRRDFPDLSLLRIDFNIDLNRMVTPLRNRVSVIRELLTEVQTTLETTQGLADSKWWSCKFHGANCSQETEAWAAGRVAALSCRIIEGCTERTVHRKTLCKPDEFQCADSGQCVPATSVCDGWAFCADGSDETAGCSRYCFNGFHCRNLLCIDPSLICNGKDDCKDGSDEEFCSAKNNYTPENCSIENDAFLCHNGRCIKHFETCDEHDDCGDESDEGERCLETECGNDCRAQNGVCLPGPGGPTCLNSCPVGMEAVNGVCNTLPSDSTATLSIYLSSLTELMDNHVVQFKELRRDLHRTVAEAVKTVVECKESDAKGKEKAPEDSKDKN